MHNTIKYTNETFILKANSIHNNKYDYSKIQYVNSITPIIIICPIHGQFLQKPSVHLNKCGCTVCGYIENRKTTEEYKNIFIEKAKQVHNNKYNYSLVDYKKSQIKVKILCPIHGMFKQQPNMHISGTGCPKCRSDKMSNLLKNTKEEFITNAQKCHGTKYDYSLVQYIDNRTKIKIICPIHGIFEQTPDAHTNQNAGCQICRQSKGETAISLFLYNNSINYISQNRFEDCKGIKHKLPFDFYLPDYNMCIEYDGEQHFKQRLIRGKLIPIEAFESTKRNDNIKTNYCLTNNIKLIRIPYWNINDIDHILSMILSH